MSNRSLATSSSLQRLLKLLPDALSELFEFVTDRVADKVVERLSSTAGDYYDQDNLPAGLSRRAYLRAARQGEFPSSKVKRRVITKRRDLDAWIARHLVEPKADAHAEEDETVEQIASRSGFRVRR